MVNLTRYFEEILVPRKIGINKIFNHIFIRVEFKVYEKEKNYVQIRQTNKFRAGSNWWKKNYLSLNDLLW